MIPWRRPHAAELYSSGNNPAAGGVSIRQVDRTPEDRLESSELERFEAVVLPHLDAAYTLARYLTRNDHDAQDVVQDASLRALRYFHGFRGAGSAEGRAWLLAIVRNPAYTWQRRHRADPPTTAFEAQLDAYLDGELAAPDAAELEQHLRACPECSRLERRRRALSAALRDQLPRFPAPDTLRAGVRAGARAEAGRRARRRAPSWG